MERITFVFTSPDGYIQTELPFDGKLFTWDDVVERFRSPETEDDYAKRLDWLRSEYLNVEANEFQAEIMAHYTDVLIREGQTSVDDVKAVFDEIRLAKSE